MTVGDEDQSRMYQEDFTCDHYFELLRIAKSYYRFIDYKSISFEKPFVLWRHDVDFSLNRSLRLAQIEREAGVSSTFFIHLRSEFYNPLEETQTQCIQEILKLGHSIGIHFDAESYKIESEKDFDRFLGKEVSIFESAFDVCPEVFSFHNPTEFLLSCEKDYYCGLINCYSGRFKKEISYVSDSNGYWRFRRLADVLIEHKDRYLQVLTHPNWWQERSMTPFERILRSVEGRKESILKRYSETLSLSNRKNVGKD